MTEKLAAIDENRIFYFYLVNKEELLITIDMYNTIYTFVKKQEAWINHNNNKMQMAPHLISAVIKALPA